MYGLFSEGEPFRVFARRESLGASALVLKFECKEGMGILGLRKAGRTDPAPAPAYEEEDIDPGSLRAGRFVHVLPSGQRQSYALSRISTDVAGRMPTDRWVELKPHTEYGFRYLVVPDDDLDSTTASVRLTPGGATPLSQGPRSEEESSFDLPTQVSRDLSPSRDMAPSREGAPPLREPASSLNTGPTPKEPSRDLPPLREQVREATGPLPPAQAVVSPPLAEAALRMLTRDQAVEYLKSEMHKVHVLQLRVAELEQANRRGRQREKDLIELLAKWEAS